MQDIPPIPLAMGILYVARLTNVYAGGMEAIERAIVHASFSEGIRMKGLREGAGVLTGGFTLIHGLISRAEQAINSGSMLRISCDPDAHAYLAIHAIRQAYRFIEFLYDLCRYVRCVFCVL